MDVVILRASCRNLLFFEEGSVDIDFVAEKRVFQHENEGNTVSHLFNSVYKLNTLAFAGINATGKTTILNILSAVLRTYLGNDSLDYNMKLTKYFKDTLELETYYFHRSNNLLYKLVSHIKKDDSTESISFLDETLSLKKITSQTNGANLYDFTEKDIWLNRSTLKNAFLKDEDSIFSSVMNNNRPSGPSVIDMCGTTNRNIISGFSLDVIMPIVNYLDPSVEMLSLSSLDENRGRLMFEIKFKKSSETLLVDAIDLEQYLSSGTIKGISCISNILRVFESGGYLLIDEIENHLNKTIVINIMSMFTSSLNKNAATLLFSSHYSEMLDSVDRSDGIYLLGKSEKMRVEKFSTLASKKDRKDKKRSDLILSGALSNAPSYEAYKLLTSSLRQALEEDGLPDD